MTRNQLLKKYRNKIFIIYKTENQEKIATFKKLSEAQDFQESGYPITALVNLRHVKNEENVIEFLESLIFDGHNL